MPRKTKRKNSTKKDDTNQRVPPFENKKQRNDGLNNKNTSQTSVGKTSSSSNHTQSQSNGVNITKVDETQKSLPTHLNDNNTLVTNTSEDANKLMVKEIIVDPHIKRLFDHIRYSEEAVSVLPNRSWAIHCTDVPVKCIVISEMVMHNAHGRGLEPFYPKQIIFDEKLNFELFLLNSRTLLKDKPSRVGNMDEFESVLDYVNSIKLCHGGPDITEYSNVNPECAYKDPYNKWRHNLCLLEINECDVCEPCVSLEEILKRHAQRKSPLKSRNNNVLKRKRTYI
ncbi:hypothetical protein PV328_006769 [Microctonus aethiopoides]|uniref:Uncharacterized protein n=1 Tax=Microctonus aethiopoides TaxID=144406 RepID=A0AA39FQC8_9HYME|nr:hypothetical protein PV328_006769 [Microctonus aethiopoides]